VGLLAPQQLHHKHRETDDLTGQRHNKPKANGCLMGKNSVVASTSPPKRRTLLPAVPLLEEPIQMKRVMAPIEKVVR
jgi:hypothetical protein